MITTLSKILLFTVNACPTGRHSGQVLREVSEATQVPVETYFVDEQVEETNRYRVKTNPTTLFVDDGGTELFRFEGFKETSEVLELLTCLREQGIENTIERDTNEEETEHYTVYLLQGSELTPYELKYLNCTAVKTPRITAIKQLLAAHPEGYINPFPTGTQLDLVQFDGGKGRITLYVQEDVTKGSIENMRHALEKTLAHFGVQDVELLLLEK